MQEQWNQYFHTKWMGKRLFFKEEVDSTITWSKNAAKESHGNELDGAVFLADLQTGGKGRVGRVWISPPGENIYMNLLLIKPEIYPMNASSLTLIMGMAVAKAAQDLTGKSVGIKWPNDVVMSKKKICGILTQMQVSENMPEYITIGVGINVNQKQFQEELKDKATSLFLETGKPYVRGKMAGKTIEYFEEYYEQFLKTQNLAFLKEEYEAVLLNKDQPVRILEMNGERVGIARGISEKGELLVEYENKEIEKILSGEVSVRGLYSYV